MDEPQRLATEVRWGPGAPGAALSLGIRWCLPDHDTDSFLRVGAHGAMRQEFVHSAVHMGETVEMRRYASREDRSAQRALDLIYRIGIFLAPASASSALAWFQ